MNCSLIARCWLHCKAAGKHLLGIYNCVSNLNNVLSISLKKKKKKQLSWTSTVDLGYFCYTVTYIHKIKQGISSYKGTPLLFIGSFPVLIPNNMLIWFWWITSSQLYTAKEDTLPSHTEAQGWQEVAHPSSHCPAVKGRLLTEENCRSPLIW